MNDKQIAETKRALEIQSFLEEKLQKLRQELHLKYNDEETRRLKAEMKDIAGETVTVCGICHHEFVKHGVSRTDDLSKHEAEPHWCKAAHVYEEKIFVKFYAKSSVGEYESLHWVEGEKKYYWYSDGVIMSGVYPPRDIKRQP